MSLPEAAPPLSFFEKLSRVAILLLISIGVCTVAGWQTGDALLASWIPGGPPMKFNSALIFSAAGSALWLLRRPDAPRARRMIAHALAGFIGIMGLLALAQHHFSLNVGIDHLFYSRTDRFPEPHPVSWASHPGRFSPIGGWLSLIMSFAIFSIDVETRKRHRPSQYACLALGIFGTIATLAYLFGVDEFFNLSLYTRLAFPGGVALLAFAVGGFFARPDKGIASVMISPWSGGMLARRLIPASFLSIAAIGWASWSGAEAGFYNEAYAFAMFTTASLFVILGLVWRNAYALNVLDIDRSEAELSLRRGQERFALAVGAAEIGFWDWDLRSNELQYSETYAKIFDLESSGDKTDVKSAIDRILEEDREAVGRIIEVSIAEKKEYRAEFRIRHRDGSVRWVNGRGRALYDETGAPARMLGVNMDITERKRAEERLQDAVRRANEANELKSAFLANMSHEIRTPLGAVLGFTELLKDSEATEEEKAIYFETITRNGEQLSSLINDILDLSKVEAGQLLIETLPTNPRKLMNELISSLEVKAREKKLGLTCHVNPDLAEQIGTDPMRLKQILSNVIGNALKFTPQGSIETRVERGECGRIRFVVKDTGIGIEKDQLDHLFRPFSQADVSMTRKYGGTGLGLALSKRLAQSLGGDLIVIWSKIGEGSIFEIVIEDRMEQVKAAPDGTAFSAATESSV